MRLSVLALAVALHWAALSFAQPPGLTFSTANTAFNDGDCTSAGGSRPPTP